MTTLFAGVSLLPAASGSALPDLGDAVVLVVALDERRRDLPVAA